MRPCPRCDHKDIIKIGDSPISGAWELYRCSRCHFVWRSTETDELFAATMKLTEKDLRELINIHTLKSISQEG
ncbi:MAG: non-oxidative hydroxyarylic acid decarboxylases subunit D [Dehalococcoidia bacterium]|nr:non-oxidative hydroxyarylic acid decarboxylases subunit D [Dehalococcoidia bacterium]